MINPTMKTSGAKLKRFSTILSIQLRVLLEKHHKLNCTMNLALNYLNLGDEWEGFVCSVKSKRLRYLNILHYLIPSDHQTYNTRNLDFVETYFCRINALKYSFFPYSISEWNKLDSELRNAKSYSTFRKSLLNSGWPNPNHVYQNHDPLGLKILTRLRLSLRYLN